MKEVATFIRDSRKENGFTQEKLAVYAGVSLHFLINLEKGKESVQADKVNKVLRIFNKKLGVIDA